LLCVLGCAADGSAPTLLRTALRAAGVSPAAVRIHVVQAGDTVWAIAGGRSGCTRAILAASEIRDARRIQPGAELTVPEEACPPGAKDVAVKARAAEPAGSKRTRPVPVAGLSPAGAGASVAASGVLPDGVAPARVTARVADSDGLADTLTAAEAHLRAARFEEALAEARDAMRRVDARGREAEALRAHLIAATVHVARADRPAARESLARALDIDPALALDPQATSPKVLEVLAAERARREVRVARTGSRR